MHKPSWFKPGLVAVSNAPTCGINKDGQELYVVDAATGRRTTVIDNALERDVRSLIAGEPADSLVWVDADEVRRTGVAVPTYYDERTLDDYRAERARKWPSYKDVTLGDLMESGQLVIRGGHGSPSADVRTGTVPYIKVSDLRAGQVNINPTNRVSDVTARHHWRGPESGLKPFDLISPARTSKNIGDLAVLMPGQEQVVLTKEVLVLRPGPKADFDPFYLLWAMSLRIVREQWRRIVFMQTNREDTGNRYREIVIPIGPSRAKRDAVSEPFRSYYEGMASLRSGFREFLDNDPDHHVFLGTVAPEDFLVDEESDAEA